MRTNLKSLSSVFHLRRRPHPLLLTLRGAASTLATPPRNALMFDPALLEGDKPSANVAFAARKASSTDEALRQLSLALAPSDQPTVAVPPSYQRDLDELYDVLMRPLPPVPTQRDRIEKLRATEALDEAAFFAERDRSDVEQYAHRIRCLGAQGHLAAAHEVLNDMLRQQPAAPALERHGEGEGEGEGTTTATVAVPAARVVTPAAPANVHIVVKGESLDKIAKTHGTTAVELQKLNRITDPKKLQIGQQLMLPQPTPKK